MPESPRLSTRIFSMPPRLRAVVISWFRPARPATSRFSLSSLLIVPLLISPLLLSAVFIRQQFEWDRNHISLPFSAAQVFNTFFCVAAYAAFFTARSLRRGYQQGPIKGHHVLRATRKGAALGILFMVQVIVPWAIAYVASRVHDTKLPLRRFLLVNQHLAIEAAWTAGCFTCALGPALGAFGGSLVGFVFDWQYTHGRREPD